VLAAEELQDIPLKCEVIHAPLDDAVPTKKELETALDAAWKVYNARKAGKRVLVTCAQGINRSALIVALVLMIHGMPAERAITRIRALRKGVILQPLCNQAFVKVLHQIEKNRRRRR